MMPPAPPNPGLAARLKDAIVDLRGDLDISRHVFRDGPAYVVRDPITFATHRFDADDYIVLSALRRDWTLGQTFEHLVGIGELERPEEENFYAFVLDLHQRSLLTLPINNADALYQRFEKRRRAERLSRVLGVLFLRVPLVNPDRFLASTLPFFRWLFTTPALLVWVLANAAAIGLAATRWDELTAPVLTVIEGNNLFMLWGALIGLKVVHEFGHAYACKSFGGHVPEMGAFMILFTPVAYVDATDSWTFSKARERAIVTLGGVYFESIVGIIALFVWAATEVSTLHTLAYQIVVLSTVTTAAFNLNPLVRYDAYYLVSDLLAIPNLRARCQEALTGYLKRALFGVKPPPHSHTRRTRIGLALFGLAQAAYRVSMMLSIVAVLVLKFGRIGFLFAAVMLVLGPVKALASLARYVLTSAETAHARLRAVTVTFGSLALALAGAALIPLPWPIDARGVVSFERVDAVRAPVRGVLAAPLPAVGQTVHEGETLATLTNPDLDAHLAGLRAEHQTHEARVLFASLVSPVDGMEAEIDARRLDASVEQTAAELDSLDIKASLPGRILEHRAAGPGATVEQGDPILLYASGRPEAIFHVRGFEFDSLELAAGDSLTCRSAANPERDITGTITHIDRVASAIVDHRVLLAAPQGLVPMLPGSPRATEPYFEIRVALHPADARLAGAEVRASLPSHPRTAAEVLKRRVIRFLNRVKEGAGS